MLNELVQKVGDITERMINEVHTMIPGKIVSYDPEKNLAKVLPIGKYRKPDKTTLDYPQISDVPVYLIQGSNQDATIVYPIKPDDGCLLFFSEQELDYWLSGAESENVLHFDLTNAIAVVGMFVKPNPLIKEACDDNSLIIEKEGERVRLKKGETYISDTAGQSITFTPDAVTVVANKFIVQSKGNITLNGSTINLN